MRIERRLGIRSAYGQLVLIIFLPIAILASVGAVLVFLEITRAVKSEQDALAQAALIHYEPMVRALLSEPYAVDSLKALTKDGRKNGVTGALIPQQYYFSQRRRFVADQMYQTQSEQHVLRIGVLDHTGKAVMSVGYQQDAPWGNFDATADSVWRLKTEVGTAYGMPIYTPTDNNKEQMRFWLFVDMDNEPLTISYYRIWLALAITGLTTILLLLLILNLYSRRWITPVYEMRLFLQKLTASTLGQPLTTKNDGEFYILQKELNLALKRLNGSFLELKKYSEETEADLQEAFDEMEMQNISIRKARDEAILASQTKSAFLANISHELRTPLNAIDGFIHLLSHSKNLDSKQNLYVQTIQKSSTHLLALINDVLDFSKIEAGKLTLEQHSFNLYDAVYEVADMLSPTAFDKGLRFVVMIYQDVPNYYVGDRLRIKQILTNLVGNAIKFTDRGGIFITLSIEEIEQKNAIKILVSDTGRGVDKALGRELFKSFEQGDLSITRRYGGTGLGLAISKELVGLMGGKIDFFNNADTGRDSQGASFWFTLPVDDSDFVSIDMPTKLDNLRILAWLTHTPAFTVLASSLAMTGHQTSLIEAKSLAQLLENLATGGVYDWVITDSFGQEGDIGALLSQIRSHYQGKLMVYGYEVALDTQVLSAYDAHLLPEPLDRRTLYAIFDDKTPKKAPKINNYEGTRVLCVDDHLPNLLVLEALLGELGVKTIQADSGFSAIEQVQRAEQTGQRIDLIFMDIQMPAMSGIQTASAIRNLEREQTLTPPMPIIALSAHGIWHDMDGLKKAGINDYATKPIAKQALADLLEKWLTKAPMDETSINTNAFTDTKVSGTGASDNHPANADTTFVAPTDNGQNTATEPSLDFDPKDALIRASNNEALAKKLFSMLCATLDEESTTLKNAWQENTQTTLFEAIHRLLGATRYTGTPRLRQACESLHAKMLSMQGNWDKAKLEADVQEVLASLNALMVLSKHPPQW